MHINRTKPQTSIIYTPHQHAPSSNECVKTKTKKHKEEEKPARNSAERIPMINLASVCLCACVDL